MRYRIPNRSKRRRCFGCEMWADVKTVARFRLFLVDTTKIVDVVDRIWTDPNVSSYLSADLYLAPGWWKYRDPDSLKTLAPLMKLYRNHRAPEWYSTDDDLPRGRPYVELIRLAIERLYRRYIDPGDIDSLFFSKGEKDESLDSEKGKGARNRSRTRRSKTGDVPVRQ